MTLILFAMAITIFSLLFLKRQTLKPNYIAVVDFHLIKLEPKELNFYNKVYIKKNNAYAIIQNN